ncbi:MAG: Phosphoribosylformylglycinamidine cyclo-ligase [Acidimicrobiaceae bacterium]|nr:Phosphoribosylformylglycinamidine cyclo-ligase [Acidimicrobiaceae bacterium]
MSGPSAYERAGVDYDTLDAAKRTALAAALSTTSFPLARGARLDDASRGEPAVVVEVGGVTLGFVLECLGTKSTIARAYEELSGVDRFDAIGYDTVAAVVNDCCCVGALPFVVNAYFATGSASWYAGSRHASLVAGWRRACADSGAAWGGGESPTLAGLVATDGIDLAGSAVGRVPDGVAPLLGAALVPGDEIVLVASSGLHANGASLAREVASALPAGLETPLASGRSYGEALLDESVIYVALVDAILERRVPLHYASHITGHGLRKLMRADRELTYRIDRLPAVPEVLAFVASEAGLTERDAYATLNMGSGFALYCGAGSGAGVVEIATELGYVAVVAGAVEHGRRRVVLEPVGVEYASDELELR